MKTQKKNIGLAVQPYVEGIFHSINTLICCYISLYAKSGVKHLFNEGIYSNYWNILKTGVGVKHLFNEGIYSIEHDQNFCTLGVKHLFNEGIYSL